MGGVRLLPTELNVGAGSDVAAGRVSIEATETSGVCARDHRQGVAGQGVTPEWVENNAGVIQGCVMSSTLFSLLLEKLIVRIRKDGKEVEIGGERLGCLAYSDDVVLMVEKREEMGEILQIGHT